MVDQKNRGGGRGNGDWGRQCRNIGESVGVGAPQEQYAPSTGSRRMAKRSGQIQTAPLETERNRLKKHERGGGKSEIFVRSGGERRWFERAGRHKWKGIGDVV